jgi:rubredoxin
MKIVKKGEIPNKTKRFTCKLCGTVFEAERGEYHAANQIGWMEGIEYVSTCPVCKNTVFIDRRSK